MIFFFTFRHSRTRNSRPFIENSLRSFCKSNPLFLPSFTQDIILRYACVISALLSFAKRHSLNPFCRLFNRLDQSLLECESAPRVLFQPTSQLTQRSRQNIIKVESFSKSFHIPKTCRLLDISPIFEVPSRQFKFVITKRLNRLYSLSIKDCRLSRRLLIRVLA